MPQLPLFFLIPLLICLPVTAQERMDGRVATLCDHPPMDAHQVDRMRRDRDFFALLDGLAMACPDVAMLFAQFVIGEVGHSAADMPKRHPPDFLCHFGPAKMFGQTASIPQF